MSTSLPVASHWLSVTLVRPECLFLEAREVSILRQVQPSPFFNFFNRVRFDELYIY